MIDGLLVTYGKDENGSPFTYVFRKEGFRLKSKKAIYNLSDLTLGGTYTKEEVEQNLTVMLLSGILIV